MRVRIRWERVFSHFIFYLSLLRLLNWISHENFFWRTTFFNNLDYHHVTMQCKYSQPKWNCNDTSFSHLFSVVMLSWHSNRVYAKGGEQLVFSKFKKTFRFWSSLGNLSKYQKKTSRIIRYRPPAVCIFSLELIIMTSVIKIGSHSSKLFSLASLLLKSSKLLVADDD